MAGSTRIARSCFGPLRRELDARICLWVSAIRLPGVTDPDFDARLARLIKSLDETVNLLLNHGESHWFRWATSCRAALHNNDAAAFDRVLGAFGGMGSFNDLWILRINGHAVEPDQESTVNARLTGLRSAIWDDAMALRHELRASP